MKKINLFLLVAISFLGAYAQKLPNVQQVSLRAPANVKIDGKADEWKGRFLANNVTTGIAYALSNDDKRLFLVVQTSNDNVINRIVNGGIKLVIQKNGTKSEKNAPFVKFPYLQKGQKTDVNFSTDRVVSTAYATMTVRQPKPSSKAEQDRIADSLAKQNNKRIASNSKLIYTSGFADVENLLPIYNEKGIEAASAVDSKKMYTWELAVDLKLVDLNAEKTAKFSYHIVINDEPNKYTLPVVTVVDYIAPDGTRGNADQIKGRNDEYQALAALRSATTDFWGEYTLAK